MPVGTDCALCGGSTQAPDGALGSLVGPVQAEGADSSCYVHRLCALWSPEVYQTEQGTLRHVGKAVRRGRLMPCTQCGKRGATVGCRVEKCAASYHVWCAKLAGCHFNDAQFLMSCPEHIPPGALLHRRPHPEPFPSPGQAHAAACYANWAQGSHPAGYGINSQAARAGVAEGRATAVKRPAARTAQTANKRARVDTAAVSAHMQAARLALAVYRQAGNRQGLYSCESVTEVHAADLDDETEWAMKEARRLAKDTSRMAPIILAGTGGRDAAVRHAHAMHGAANGASPEQVWGSEAAAFESLGGLPHVMTSLREMALVPLMYPQLMTQLGITPPRGLLLHGVPGSGKTAAVRALAGECAHAAPRPVALFVRKGADCLGKYVGDAERTLRLLFQEASRYAPSIIFLDEVDALAPNRAMRESTADQVHASVVSTLLSLMDGLHDRGQVLVLAATNRPDTLDPALRRPGRFDREVQFTLPGADARADILARMTHDWPQDSQPSTALLQQLAHATEGYAGADLQALSCSAVLAAARRTAAGSLFDTLPVLAPPSPALHANMAPPALDTHGESGHAGSIHEADVEAHHSIKEAQAAAGFIEHNASDAVPQAALNAADVTARLVARVAPATAHGDKIERGRKLPAGQQEQQQQQQLPASQTGHFASKFTSVLHDFGARSQASGHQPSVQQALQATNEQAPGEGAHSTGISHPTGPTTCTVLEAAAVHDQDGAQGQLLVVDAASAAVQDQPPIEVAVQAGNHALWDAAAADTLAAQRPGFSVASVCVGEQDWWVALSNAAAPASQREPPAIMQAGRKPLPHTAAPILLPTLVAALQHLSRSLPQVLPAHMQQCLETAASGQLHASESSRDAILDGMDARGLVAQRHQVEQQLTAMGVVEPEVAASHPTSNPDAGSMHSGGVPNGAASVGYKGAVTASTPPQQQRTPAQHVGQQPPVRLLLCGGHADELQAVATAMLCVFSTTTQLVSLSLPSLVLQGEGDPIAGCHRAMAEACRLHATDVPLVVYMPALESWAVTGVAKFGKDMMRHDEQDDSGSEHADGDEQDAVAELLECDVTPMWPMMMQCVTQTIGCARGPVVLLATCSLPLALIPAQILSSFTTADSQLKQQPAVSIPAAISISSRTAPGSDQEEPLLSQAVSHASSAGSIQVWQAPGAAQLQQCLTRTVRSMVATRLTPLLMQSIQRQQERGSQAAQQSPVQQPATPAGIVVAGTGSTKAAAVGNRYQQQHGCVSAPVARVQPLSEAEKAQAAKLQAQIQAFIQSTSQRLLKDLRMTVLLRYAAHTHQVASKPARHRLHVASKQTTSTVATDTSAHEREKAHAHESHGAQQGAGDNNGGKAQHGDDQHWKESEIFHHLLAASEGHICNLEDWLGPLRASLELLRQQAMQTQGKQQPEPSCRQRLSGNTKYCWQAAAAAAVLDEVEAATAIVMQALGLLNPAVSALLSSYMQQKQQQYPDGTEQQGAGSLQANLSAHAAGGGTSPLLRRAQEPHNPILHTPAPGKLQKQDAQAGRQLGAVGTRDGTAGFDAHAFGVQLEQLVLRVLTQRMQPHLSSLVANSSTHTKEMHERVGDDSHDAQLAQVSLLAAVQHQAHVLLQQVVSCWAHQHQLTPHHQCHGGIALKDGQQPAASAEWAAELLRSIATQIEV